MCEGLSKISSNFTLHLIKVGKLKRFKKVSSDLKTILKTNLANLRFLSFEKGQACQSILIMLRGKIGLRNGPLEKLWGREGNFQAAGIFFRYQIPCMNFF